MHWVKYSFLAILFIFPSCEAENAEELFKDSECPNQNISFSSDVLPILQIHCTSCHNSLAALGGVVLDTYPNVKIWVDNERLMGSVKHMPGFSPMPQVGEKLDDCSISKIEAWIEDGSPDN